MKISTEAMLMVDSLLSTAPHVFDRKVLEKVEAYPGVSKEIGRVRQAEIVRAEAEIHMGTWRESVGHAAEILTWVAKFEGKSSPDPETRPAGPQSKPINALLDGALKKLSETMGKDDFHRALVDYKECFSASARWTKDRSSPTDRCCRAVQEAASKGVGVPELMESLGLGKAYPSSVETSNLKRLILAHDPSMAEEYGQVSSPENPPAQGSGPPPDSSPKTNSEEYPGDLKGYMFDYKDYAEALIDEHLDKDYPRVFLKKNPLTSKPIIVTIGYAYPDDKGRKHNEDHAIHFKGDDTRVNPSELVYGHPSIVFEEVFGDRKDPNSPKISVKGIRPHIFMLVRSWHSILNGSYVDVPGSHRWTGFFPKDGEWTPVPVEGEKEAKDWLVRARRWWANRKS